jgi:hypothetical protein
MVLQPASGQAKRREAGVATDRADALDSVPREEALSRRPRSLFARSPRYAGDVMATDTACAASVAKPPFRRLRCYAFDPSLSLDLDAAVINEAVLKVPWEEEVKPGPVGDYLEIVDYDPASGAFYAPVDLDHPHLLAQDGHPPSEGNPQFHQQMIYAVAMTTIRHFELALGRPVLWSPRLEKDAQGKVVNARFVRRLRCYPHALREANAYYSPAKKALLFGYFPASRSNPGRNLPGGMVFTCLSHDIIVHETTHAILDGLHRRYVEPSGPDALAFHEALADIVALFQHFTLPEAVRHQIAQTRGDIGQQNLLGELAKQFGQAIGMHGALRSAINQFDPATGEPDPGLLDKTRQPHARGAILVAAVFDAFLAIYKARIADLLRLVTGSGTAFPNSDLHPDLLNRLAHEANKAATHVLRMCIRALDYCPPVDVTFGEYLRALITADQDLVEDDDLGYRIAMVEAFRRRGIYPSDCRSLSIDGLRWRPPMSPISTEELPDLKLGMPPDRKEAWERDNGPPDKSFVGNRETVWRWLKDSGLSPEHQRALGLHLGKDAPPTIERSRFDGLPKVEVHSVRPARRAGPDGQQIAELVIEITQARRGYRTAEIQEKAESRSSGELPPADFKFRGGCTLLIDMSTRKVRYAVRKDILSERRLQRQRDCLFGGEETTLAATYFGRGAAARRDEPFAFLHRGL